MVSGERPDWGARRLFTYARAETTMLAAHVDWILLITGLLTTGAVAVFLAPVTMMRVLFGQAPCDSLSLMIVRHWGLLISVVGVLLMDAAFHAEIRVSTMSVAALEKVGFALGV